MLKLRLQRVGRVHEPSFRLVLTESENSTKSGRFKEILGSYDPRKDGDSLNVERIKYWLSTGAQPTSTVHNLLVKHKILDVAKINVSPKPKPPAEAPLPEATKENIVDTTAEEPATESVEAEVPAEPVASEAEVAPEAPAESAE